LSLDNVNNVHWTARGFLVFSLVTAIVSVYYASKQYRILGRCLTPEDIQTWITTGRGGDRGKFPRAASVLTISAPGALLNASVHGFLIGFGIYLGFLWTRDLDDSIISIDKKAVFLTYIITLAVSYTLYAISSIVAGEQAGPTNVYAGVFDG